MAINHLHHEHHFQFHPQQRHYYTRQHSINNPGTTFTNSNFIFSDNSSMTIDNAFISDDSYVLVQIIGNGRTQTFTVLEQ